jgi:N-acetyl sugar amidotransferase
MTSLTPDVLAPAPSPAGAPHGDAPHPAGYRVCARCIMDTSDPNIAFDDDGVCSHCHAYRQLVQTMLPPPGETESRLARLVDDMRRSGRGREYDCVIGVSGGVDSTYVAYTVKRLGLRPLAVHMDNGWNSTLAVTNIERALKRLGIDLHTDVLDWDEFRDLQLSFLRASTPDAEIPSDHAITAVLMRAARRHGVRYVIGGSNVRSEAIMPLAWSQGIRDWKYIRSVHAEFGTVPLRTFPHFTLLDFMRFRSVEGKRHVDILNYIDYNKTEAMKVIERELGWVYYGGKHYESVYTRFFQAYILPVKFGYDKRRGHLSTLVCSGEMTRDEALEAMRAPVCPPALLREDREFVIKKLGLTEAEFERIMALPPRRFEDYPSYERGLPFRALRWAYRVPRRLRARGATRGA